MLYHWTDVKKTRQLTREEAMTFATTDAYKAMTPKERGAFQLQQELLCIPFSDFHEGAEALLGRPVFTHEFADPKTLIAEANAEIDPATLDDVMNKIPHGKTIVVVT